MENSHNLCVSWEGVTCSNVTGHVIMLDLGGLNLEGIISPEVSRLKNLEVLDLSLNNLVGPLPKEFGMMKKLKTLYLPCEIPEFIGNLSSLEVIWADIAIGGIPRSIGQLTNLRHVEISFGYIFGSIPEELGNCSKLEEIYIHAHNIFEGFIALPPHLKVLSLRHLNGTAPIPKEIWNSTHLEELSLIDCSLTGSLPPQLGVQFRILDLSYNFLSGDIPSYSSNRQSLDLSYNMFCGNIPVSLGQMGGLTNLDLSNNRFTGNIPTSVEHLSNLSDLSLGSNLLTGAIPMNLRQLSNLDLHNNSLNATLPNFLTTTSIQELYLSRNRFNGHMPPISREVHLLNLAENMLTEEMPKS
ncbi:hypothetical protein SELMODRAFT_123884 [Selaginella moellendorffii]|uniref:Disease resistance R13L4/SHOC-2-like LRR domain-containing protein n=1 Tax=Selaginella moellendorffii TaxID=88036 RepID=D8SSN4_SELML|nr:hypothetical protein SELMODRAFT_123884 [Selaginella moellendorffii]